nr:putative RNA-directed DNA polymerase, eukaryota, reverse transcriptase zinc-binding domain protein [Tanacetum cinerariifolium]
DSPDKVKREFLDHFTKRFSKPGEREASLFMDFSKQLNDDQQKELESKVSNEEIKRAIWDCGTDKAPGPDGFTFGCNSLFIALIPKILDANLVKDFRPISLIGSIYKISAKVLTNRLVGVLREIVNEVQSAFIADRQILDGPFILNEVIKWCKVKKKQALSFKVDFEKAYDSVRWDFLDDILCKFGFDDKWRNNPGEREASLFMDFPKQLNDDQQKELESEVSNEEIKRAVWDCGTDKAPGPDGFTFGFFRQFWNLIDNDVYEAVSEVNALSEKDIELLNARIKLGDGESTVFWEDLWYEGGKLKEMFPRLYNLKNCKGITVGRKLAQPNIAYSFRRTPRGGAECDQMEELERLIQSVRLSL